MRLKLLLSKAVEKMAAANTKMEFRLMDLPNELIAQIIEFVSDVAALQKLARTCQRLEALTAPVLWRHILLRKPARLIRILQAYERRRERALALQSLDVPCDPNMTDMSSLAFLLTAAPNLRALFIQSPSCNESDFEDEESWKPMMFQLSLPFQRAQAGLATSNPPLQKLSRLTLHLNGPGSPYWTPDASSLSIFLLPSLKYLKVSCVTLPEDVFGEVNLSGSISLRELVLEECNISHGGLRGLLALPKALETLYLGENYHNERHFDNHVPLCYNGLFFRDTIATLEALSQQKDSLKSLTYVSSGLQSGSFMQRLRLRQPGVDAGFADFNALESVTAVGSCAPFERAVMSSKSPPNLRSLHFESEKPFSKALHTDRSVSSTSDSDLLASLPFLRAPSATLPGSLQELSIIELHYIMPPSEMPVAKRRHIVAVARALKKAHNATLMVKTKFFGSYYPPILHGEPNPFEEIVYDGFTDRFKFVDPALRAYGTTEGLLY